MKAISESDWNNNDIRVPSFILPGAPANLELLALTCLLDIAQETAKRHCKRPLFQIGHQPSERPCHGRAMLLLGKITRCCAPSTASKIPLTAHHTATDREFPRERPAHDPHLLTSNGGCGNSTTPLRSREWISSITASGALAGAASPSMINVTGLVLLDHELRRKHRPPVADRRSAWTHWAGSTELADRGEPGLLNIGGPRPGRADRAQLLGLDG